MKIRSYIMKMLLFILLYTSLYAQSISETNFSGVVGSGARAYGMGGAFIAIADDATAVSWNPGGLGQLENPEFSFVARGQSYYYLFPAKSNESFFMGPEDFSGSSYNFDFASFTYPFRIGEFKLVPQVSYQRSISFNLESDLNNVRYTNTFYDTAKSAYSTVVGYFTLNDSFTGGFDTISLSLGSKLFKGFNFGISVNIWMNGYEGTRTFSFRGAKTIGRSSPQTIQFSSESSRSFDIKGINFNAGILLEIIEGLKLGAVYKSSFDADISYNNLARGEALGPNHQVLSRGEITFTGDTKLKWPDTYGIGLAYSPIDPLTFSLDYTHTSWSKAIIKNFNNALTEEREIDFYFPTLIPTDSELLKQNDTEQIRLGIEYIYLSKTVFIPFRLGFFTDTQYFTDSSGEKIIFYGITGGLGIKLGPVAVDAAMVYEFGNFLELNIAYSATDFSEVRFYLSTIFSL